MVAWHGHGHDYQRVRSQWIGLRENLEETIDFTMKIMGGSWVPVIFPLSQSIEQSEVNFKSFLGP